MRKFFALALAVAMVLSLASVSFAATTDPEGNGEIVLSPFFKYDGDTDIFTDLEASDLDAQYGKSYYALILEEMISYTVADADLTDGITLANGDTRTTSLVPLTDYDQVEKLKVKAEFEMGEDLVESISIVKKSFKEGDAGEGKVDTITFTDAEVKETYTLATDTWAVADPSNDIDDIDVDPADDYYYFVEIKTKAERVVGDADVIGTLEFNRKANTKKSLAKIDDSEVDFAINLWYENNYNGGNKYNTSFTVDGSEAIELKWDDLYVLKFENDDEIEIEFGLEENNEGLFTVDASGQGKMVIDYNTKANEAICAANEGVKMFFVNFNGAKFNRTGTFEYEMEDLVAAYQVVGDELVEIAGLELDGETATFSTRTLGNYVFATAELVNPVAEAPVVEAPAAVTNPSTGF